MAKSRRYLSNTLFPRITTELFFLLFFLRHFLFKIGSWLTSLCILSGESPYSMADNYSSGVGTSTRKISTFIGEGLNPSGTVGILPDKTKPSIPNGHEAGQESSFSGFAFSRPPFFAVICLGHGRGSSLTTTCH